MKLINVVSIMLAVSNGYGIVIKFSKTMLNAPIHKGRRIMKRVNATDRQRCAFAHTPIIVLIIDTPDQSVQVTVLVEVDVNKNELC